MQGIKAVDEIMWPLQRHIKDGPDGATNRQHCNIVYEAVAQLVQSIEKLEAENSELKKWQEEAVEWVKGSFTTEDWCSHVQQLAKLLQQAEKGGK